MLVAKYVVRYIVYIACFLVFFGVLSEAVYATSGTFNISSPLQSGSVFGFIADTYSPANSHTVVTCVLELGGSSVATNSSCDPTTPTFTYDAPSGTYTILVSYASDSWTSNSLDYTAPTPTPTTSPTPTPTVTPVIVDIASTSALASDLHDMTVVNIMFGVLLLFFIAMQFILWFFAKSNV